MWVWLNDQLVVDGAEFHPFYDKSKPMAKKDPFTCKRMAVKSVGGICMNWIRKRRISTFEAMNLEPASSPFSMDEILKVGLAI